MLFFLLGCLGTGDRAIRKLMEDPDEVVAYMQAETDITDGEEHTEWDGSISIEAHRDGLVAFVDLYHALCPSLIDMDLETERAQIEVYRGFQGDGNPQSSGCPGASADLDDYWGGGRGWLAASLDVDPVPLEDVGIDASTCLPSEATELVAVWKDLALWRDSGRGSEVKLAAATWTATVIECGLGER